MDSPFSDHTRWVSENDLAAAIRDLFPVSLGHTLIVPKRFVTSFFELTEAELKSCLSLLSDQRVALDIQFHPDGYNIGVNVGTAAGQTVDHAHIHLIPRYVGDHSCPRGGVRAVIPGKASY